MMTNKAKVETRVIAFRVNKDVYDRLELRALRKKVKLGTYMKEFVEKDLFREVKNEK
jgi:hypothetical protein